MREQHYKYIERLEQLDEDKERLEKLLKYCEKMKPFSLKIFHNMRPRIKQGDSIYSKTNSARDVSYMDLEGEDHFPEGSQGDGVVDRSFPCQQVVIPERRRVNDRPCIYVF